MGRFRYPKPTVNDRELELLEKLKKEYEVFTKPGVLSKGYNKTKDLIVEYSPEKLQTVFKKTLNTTLEWEIIKAAMSAASKGFLEIQKKASQYTLNKKSIVTTLQNEELNLSRFDQVCALRSYDLDNINKKRKELRLAFMQGFLTGLPGLPGVPVNIALQFFLFFRAVQNTALYYGYDVKNDPSELEIAGAIMLESLAPTSENNTDTISGLLGKMMLAAHLSSLKHSLKNLTYKKMAEKGGAELLYVQIRALANKAATKALKDAGKEGIEAGVFRKLLEQISRKLTKEVGKKSIPLIGAFVGGLSDTWYMRRVLLVSNIMYHKRFIIEKDHRIKLLRSNK